MHEWIERINKKIKLGQKRETCYFVESISFIYFNYATYQTLVNKKFFWNARFPEENLMFLIMNAWINNNKKKIIMNGWTNKWTNERTNE